MRMSMMRVCVVVMLAAIITPLPARTEDAALNTATIEFRAETLTEWDSSKSPAWIQKAGVEDGLFDPVEKCWSARDPLAPGKGQCWIDINRDALSADLALTLLFEAEDGADVAVQLWDNTNRVVVVDLFMNIIEAADQLKTHTFIIPLQKHPAAKRIVIRRMLGNVKVYGVVLNPVVSAADGDLSELLALARTLGDPLSSENPIVKAVRSMTGAGRQNDEVASPAQPAPKPTTPVNPPQVAPSRAVPSELAAHYDFNEPPSKDGIVNDKSGNGLDLAVVGKSVSMVGGISGGAVLLDGSYFQALRNPLAGFDNVTISLWFKTASPTENYKLAAAARWAGVSNASGWNVGTHYSEFWADEMAGSLIPGAGWERRVRFNKGEWNHLAVTYDGTRMREYINGRMSFECPGTGRKIGAGAPMTVGAWMGGFHFRGVMDELRIYRRALREDEISALFRAP